MLSAGTISWPAHDALAGANAISNGIPCGAPRASLLAWPLPIRQILIRLDDTPHGLKSILPIPTSFSVRLVFLADYEDFSVIGLILSRRASGNALPSHDVGHPGMASSVNRRCRGAR